MSLIKERLKCHMVFQMKTSYLQIRQCTREMQVSVCMDCSLELRVVELAESTGRTRRAESERSAERRGATGEEGGEDVIGIDTTRTESRISTRILTSIIPGSFVLI